MQLRLDAADRLVELVEERRGPVVAEEAARRLFALRQAPVGLARSLLAEVVDTDDGYLLMEHHCPICDAAKSCLGFCNAELRLFSEALGDDVTVERTEHLLAEGRRCTYRIEPR